MTYAQVLHRVAVVHLTGGHVLTAAADTVQAHEGHTLPSLGRLVRREVAAAAVEAARAAPHILWAVEVPLAASGGRPPLLRGAQLKMPMNNNIPLRHFNMMNLKTSCEFIH